MELFDKLRNQAKMDSRRFGKRVVCRIVYDKLLSIVQKEGLAPYSILFNAETGLDPINLKMLVIPVSAYPQIDKLVKDYQTSPPDSQEQLDFEAIERTTRSRSALVEGLRQNLVLVSMNRGLPEGRHAGLSPISFDVLIDSVDVNQTIEGTYTYRTVDKIRIKEQLSNKQ